MSFPTKIEGSVTSGATEKTVAGWLCMALSGPLRRKYRHEVTDFQRRIKPLEQQRFRFGFASLNVAQGRMFMMALV